MVDIIYKLNQTNYLDTIYLTMDDVDIDCNYNGDDLGDCYDSRQCVIEKPAPEAEHTSNTKNYIIVILLVIIVSLVLFR